MVWKRVEGLVWGLIQYRSGTVNLNKVNSKFHII